MPLSTVFCDMLTDMPKLETPSNKIDFPVPFEDTELLLGAMRKSSTIKLGIKAGDWFAAQRLLTICRQFDFAFVGGIIASQLTPMVSLAPLEIFSIASQYNNIALARAALASYYNVWINNPRDPFNISLPVLGECSVPYLLGFIDCIFFCRREGNLITEEAWKSKASSFMPKVRVTSSYCHFLAVLTLRPAA